MQVSTTLVSAEAKTTARGTIYVFKDGSGQSVATTDQALASKAQGLLNQPVVADINEVTSQKINEHTGRPYVNRYLNSIEAGNPTSFAVTTGTPAPLSGFTMTVPTSPPVTVEVTARDRGIWTQSASKVAAELLKFFPQAEQTLQTFDMLVEREVTKYRAAHLDNLDSEAKLNGAFGLTGGGQVMPTQNADDDIPF